MTPKKQTVAIATACGWTDCHFPLASNVSLPFTERVLCGIPPHSTIHKPLPDYLSDLNACHEMEQVLTHDQRIDYMEWLGLCSDDHWYKVWAYVHATAAERCTAFIRTLGLWEKEKQ